MKSPIVSGIISAFLGLILCSAAVELMFRYGSEVSLATALLVYVIPSIIFTGGCYALGYFTAIKHKAIEFAISAFCLSFIILFLFVGNISALQLFGFLMISIFFSFIGLIIGLIYFKIRMRA